MDSAAPVNLQQHLYAAFLEGKTSDVTLRVRGSWHAIYKLHRVVLIQAVSTTRLVHPGHALKLPNKIRGFSSRCSQQGLRSRSGYKSASPLSQMRWMLCSMIKISLAPVRPSAHPVGLSDFVLQHLSESILMCRYLRLI